MRQPQRILVIHTAFLGDMILLSSFFRLLRARLPNAEITLLANPVGAALYVDNSWNIKVLPFDKRGVDSGISGFFRTITYLRKQNFDWCLCLHRYFRSNLLAYFSGAKELYGFDASFLSFLFDGRVNRSQHLYEAEKNIAVLQTALAANQMDPVPAQRNNLYPEILIRAQDRTAAAAIFPEFETESYVVVSPCSVWNTKRWPVDRYAQLTSQLLTKGKNVVVVGSGSAADLQVASELDGLVQRAVTDSLFSRHYRNLIGKTNLDALRAIIGHCELMVTNDSAPMHFATALQRPTVAIFGPTTKALGFFPITANAPAQIIERKLECRPCGLHGHNRCPQRHFHCMLEIDVSRVLRAVESILCP